MRGFFPGLPLGLPLPLGLVLGALVLGAVVFRLGAPGNEMRTESPSRSTITSDFGAFVAAAFATSEGHTGFASGVWQPVKLSAMTTATTASFVQFIISTRRWPSFPQPLQPTPPKQEDSIFPARNGTKW